MANILLLYDMTERDFARDLKDLLEELNIGKVKMIPVSTNKGLTLEEKEKQCFDEADGALFLITPGSKRLDDIYPSPNVNHEMGQAKQKFAGMSQNVIYLVDGECNLPVIDQKARIVFNRKDIRSVVVALTQVIQDLKAAGLFRTAPIPTEIKPEPKTITLEEIVKRLNAEREGVLLEISNRLDGRISDTDLNKFLIEKLKFDMRSVNFIKRDLESLGFLLHLNLYSTEIYSAKEWDSGIGSLSSSRPRTCISIASCMFFSAASRVGPVATQPGRSGE